MNQNNNNQNNIRETFQNSDIKQNHNSFLFPSQWGGDVIPYEIEKRERWNEGEILPDNEVLCGIFGDSGKGKTL